MKTKPEKLSGNFKARRRALRRAYQTEDLHQLRITLRRMRGLLKQGQGNRAKLLRHELARLADTTNAARDWDTLLARAKNSLDKQHYRLLKKKLLEQQALAHQPVQQMLKGGQWSEVLHDWDKYIHRHPARYDCPAAFDRSLADARQRVALAWQRASPADDTRNWHKLRIAIKDLRYCLEELPRGARGKDVSEVLKQCKRLQNYLGDWHDTVVHLRLVHKLAHEYDPDVDTKALMALRNWCEDL